MDSLIYHYLSGTTVNNRLTNFTDTADHSAVTPAFTNDLAKYGPPNAASVLRLQYDNTGNLTKDLSNGLTSIDWTLYGKTRRIVKDDGHVLTFTYDPLGNRFSKTVYTTRAGVDSTLFTEYYIREAGGNVLATYHQQQHYYFYDPYAALLNLGWGSGLSVFSGALTGGGVFGNGGGGTGPFAAAVVSGTASAMPVAFVSARIGSRSAGFYARRSASACMALADATPDLPRRLCGYDSVFGGRLYPVSEGFNGDPFLPLSAGITDTALLRACAALLFKGSDSVAMQVRYEAVRGEGLDSGVGYSPETLGGLLAGDILLWRGEEGGAEAKLRRMLWPVDSGVVDSTRLLYAGAVKRLLRDSAYGRAPILQSTDSLALALSGSPGSLDAMLRREIAGQAAGHWVTDNPEGAPSGRAGIGQVLRGFAGAYWGGASNDSGIAVLRAGAGDEALLGMVYADSPAVFVTQLLSESGAGSSVDSGRAIVASAMRRAASGSGGSIALSGTGASVGAGGPIGSPAAVMARLGGSSSTLSSVLTPLVFSQALDYDRFYLAEHTIYGSSRLGIKKYWPYQYAYEWDGKKTPAQNASVLDSNDAAYRMPWYYNGWQSLVTASETSPAGHPDTVAMYSSRIVGQKGYELTSHLGNVMAVVSDKVTEVKANPSITTLPTLAMKRAGLFAAYDYYPFGMIMPSRSVEDGSVQCIPVSRSRWVNLVNTGSNVITTTNYNNSVSLMVPGGGGATATYGTFGMGDNAVYGVALQAPGGMSVSGTMDLTPLSSGAVGVQVGVSAGVMGVEGCDGTVQVDLYRVTLDAVTSAESLELLTSGTISGVGDLTLDVSEGVSGGDALRLGFSYSGSPVFTSPSMMGARVIIPSVITSVVTRVVQTYVTLSCDTDGAFRKDYRYGFNGQQKDNEIAGVGNSLDYKERMEDTRLGRFKSVDRLAVHFPWNSPYAFAENDVIRCVDLDGNEKVSFINMSLWSQNAPEVMRGIGQGLAQLAHDLAPIRPADENDPKNLSEAWQKIKSIPSNIVNLPANLTKVYENGSVQDKSAATVQTLGLILTLAKGKSPNSATALGLVRAGVVSEARILLTKALTRQGLSNLTKQFKEKWSDNGYDYEVRAHGAEAQYGKQGTVFRVARRQQGLDANGQGRGWEYADDNNNWYKEKDLKPTNPSYNQKAAADTHIPE